MRKSIKKAQKRFIHEIKELKDAKEMLTQKANQRKEIMKQLYDILQEKEAQIKDLKVSIRTITDSFEDRLINFSQFAQQQFDENEMKLLKLQKRLECTSSFDRSIYEMEEKERKLQILAELNDNPTQKEELKGILEFVKQQKSQLMSQTILKQDENRRPHSMKKQNIHASCERSNQQLIKMLNEQITLCNNLQEPFQILRETFRSLDGLNDPKDLIQELQEKINQVQRYESLEKEHIELQIKYRQMEQKMNEVSHLNHQYIKQLQELNQEQEILIREKNAYVKEWQMKAQQQKQISVQLDGQLNQLKQEISELRRQIDVMEEENQQKSERQQTGYKGQIEMLLQTNMDLEQKLEESNNEVRELQECLIKCEKFEDVVGQLTDELRMHMEANKKLEENIRHKIDQQKILKDEIHDYQCQLNDLQAQLQVNKQQLETLSLQNHFLQQNSEQILFQQRQHEQQMMVEKQKINMYQQEIIQLKKMNEILSDENNTLQEQYDQDLMKSKILIEQLQKQVNVQRKTEEQEDYEQYIIDLNDMVNKKEQTVNQQQQIIEDLQKKYESLSQQYSSQTGDRLIQGISNTEINQMLDKQLTGFNLISENDYFKPQITPEKQSSNTSPDLIKYSFQPTAIDNYLSDETSPSYQTQERPLTTSPVGEKKLDHQLFVQEMPTNEQELTCEIDILPTE